MLCNGRWNASLQGKGSIGTECRKHRNGVWEASERVMGGILLGLGQANTIQVVYSGIIAFGIFNCIDSSRNTVRLLF